MSLVNKVLAYLVATNKNLEWTTPDGRTFQISSIHGMSGYWERFFHAGETPTRRNVGESEMQDVFQMGTEYLFCDSSKKDAEKITQAQLLERVETLFPEPAKKEEPGMVLPLVIDYSETESSPKDSMRLTFWGDSSRPNWFGDGECLSDKQTITISFGFSSLQRDWQIKEWIDQLVAVMQADDWKFVHEDVGPLGNIGEDEMKFLDDDLKEFNDPPLWEGFDASHGFTLDFEKDGTQPTFTEEEVASVQKLATDFAETVFGRKLSESGRF